MAQAPTMKQQAQKGAATPKVPPAFKIETPKTRKRYIKLLVYGNYGTGKTTLAGTAAEVDQMRDVMLIDAESGDLSLDQYDNLDRVRVSDYKTIARVADWLEVHCKHREAGDIDALRALEARYKGIDEDDIDEPRQYNTAIIDSLTEVETYCMYQLLGISDATKLDEEVASAEWAEYKRNHAMIQRLVRRFRDLPMNIIFVCAEQFVQDEMKKFKYSPMLTGKLAKQVQGFMDMVGYLTIGAAQEGQPANPRVLYVQPSDRGKYDAKNRFASYRKVSFTNPTMGSILKQVGLLEE